MSSSQKNQAFSILDLLIAIAVIGVLCGIAVPALSGTRNAATDYRLEADVDTINRAIEIYRAKGGTLEGLKDPNAILTKIKNHETKSAGLVYFLGGADQMIDLRLTANSQTPDEAKSKQARAVWNAEESRFVVTREGLGVNRFFINYD